MDRLSDYDYELPESLIAQKPLEDRSASRLLLLHKDSGKLEHLHFGDIAGILQPGDLLVLNDTRVTALRLVGRRQNGGRAELLLLSPEGSGKYRALAKPGKRIKPGQTLDFESGLRATVECDLGEGQRLVAFGPMADLEERLRGAGEVPLPPYIHEGLHDPERYQTVYSSNPGSSAAPTAGLHFTPELLEKLREKGIHKAFVTLDVGIDTFRPVQSEDLDRHSMHGERCSVPEATAIAVEACKGRVIAVGTTSVRTLETFAFGRRHLNSGTQISRLFIRPGYEFKVVDGMFTNFHFPRTTMLMLVSAFCGRKALLEAYEEAIGEKYRFLSFGDSMLVL